MAARVGAIRSTDIRNVEPTMSTPGPSSCKEEVAVDIPGGDEDDEFLLETDDLRSVHVELNRMVESSQHVFQKTILDRRTDVMVETKVVSLL